jgi:hypothetical protein
MSAAEAPINTTVLYNPVEAQRVTIGANLTASQDGFDN